MSVDIEYKNGFSAEIDASKGNYEVRVFTEDGGIVRILEWDTEPEKKADLWVRAYVEARDGDSNVEGDYADRVVELAAANERIAVLEKKYDLALRAVSTLYEHAEVAAKLLDTIVEWRPWASFLRAVMRDAKRFAPEGEYETPEGEAQ